jgi:hypothetical protein
VHHAAVAGEEGGAASRQWPFGAGLAAGEDEAGGHALDVPLEGAADGLVEVVDVEDEAAVGRGEGAEVADVGVAAELGEDAGVGAEREIVGHDRDGSAEEAEGRAAMRSYLMGDERGDAAAHGVGDLGCSAGEMRDLERGRRVDRVHRGPARRDRFVKWGQVFRDSGVSRKRRQGIGDVAGGEGRGDMVDDGLAGDGVEPLELDAEHALSVGGELPGGPPSDVPFAFEARQVGRDGEIEGDLCRGNGAGRRGG